MAAQARRAGCISFPPSFPTPSLGEAPAMADAADFRRVALALGGVAEYPHFDRRAFKARVTFATLAPDDLTANIKFTPDEQALKCAVAPDAFSALDNAWGRRGWTRATLAALSEAELRAALEMAWRHGAAKPKPKPKRR
jgi:hypothetical protein